MQQVDPLEPHRREALLQRSTRPRSVEDVGFRIAVELAGEDETRRQAAALANDGADPLLAATHAIDAGGIEEIDGPIENGPHRGLGALRVDTVTVGVRHVAEARRAETDRGDHEPR